MSPMPFFKYKNQDIYYEIIGDSAKPPLLLLHGDAASSKMFAPILGLYTSSFQVILMDLLGYGRSERVGSFPADLWFAEAQQVIALLEENSLAPVSILGTSGGALVALNVALERPDLVNAVIADSAPGVRAGQKDLAFLEKDRSKAKHSLFSRMYFRYLHGSSWEGVVDADTIALVQHAKTTQEYFHKDLSELQVPTLFTASKKDEYLNAIGNPEDICSLLAAKTSRGSVHLFEKGGHPAILSNAKEFARVAQDYL